MKAIDYRLYNRSGYLYYRAILPKPLQAILCHEEIKISLGTKDLPVARLYVAKLDIELQTLLNEIVIRLNSAVSIQDIQRAQAFLKEGVEAAKLKADLPQRQTLNFDLLSLQQMVSEKLFSQVVKEYLDDCVSNSPKTIEHKRQTYEIFQSILGDIPFNKITKIEARKFKEIVLKTPANITKMGKWKVYSEVDWQNLPDAKPQSHVTVNSRLVNMNVLFKWAEINDLYEGKNPFSGLLITKAKVNAIKRPPFTKDQLKALFSCPIYKGCRGTEPRYRLVQGDMVVNDHKYWIPLVGLYTGMRLNEICQLLVEDVQCLDGVWAINIDDTGEKNLKTTSSRRRVPIHKHLIDLGFLVYVQEQGSGRLFKSLPRSGQGSYSYKFSKEFTVILDKLKLKQSGLCFHSFRHTFIDELRNVGVEKSIAMKLVGHHSSNDIHSGYGFGYSLQVLQMHINKLSFPVLGD